MARNGYCSCPNPSHELYTQSDKALCGPPLKDENGNIVNPYPSLVGPGGDPLDDLWASVDPYHTPSGDQLVGPSHEYYYHDLVDGTNDEILVDADGQYSFLVTPVSGTGPLERTDDWDRIATSTSPQLVGLALRGDTGALKCPFEVQEGQTINYKWFTAGLELVASLTLPIENDPAPFVSNNRKRCVIHIDQNQKAYSTGSPTTVPEGEVQVTFTPDIEEGY